MEPDRDADKLAAEGLLSRLRLVDTRDQIAAAQVHALLAVAEQLQQVVQAISDRGADGTDS